jgi:hypothetical protein
MPSPSARLRAKLRLLNPAMSAASARILEHPARDALYPVYLRGMHGVSRAAVPLLEAGARRAEELDADDPLREPLAAYLRHHVREEAGHDEWILEDLEVLGVDREEVLGDVPAPAVAALVGSQLYWIAFAHPVALLGYLAVMEANPPSPEAVERLQATTGLQPEAFRSMRVHARLDVEHARDLWRTIDGLPLDARHERLVTTSALRTAELLVEALVGLVDDFERTALLPIGALDGSAR